MDKSKYFCEVGVASDLNREEGVFEIYAKDWREAKKIAEEKYIEYLRTVMSTGVIREDGKLE